MASRDVDDSTDDGLFEDDDQPRAPLIPKLGQTPIWVGIRLRPLSDRETSACFTAGPGSGVVNYIGAAPARQGARNSWNFDRVFGPESSNADVYSEICAPLVLSATLGYHGTSKHPYHILFMHSNFLTERSCLLIAP